LALAGKDSARIRHDSRPDVWLQVHASGNWEMSSELTNEAHDVIELYLPLQLRPHLVIAQLGQSLDGRIATESGHSHHVTGQAISGGSIARGGCCGRWSGAHCDGQLPLTVR
jgi:hypothetical protein